MNDFSDLNNSLNEEVQFLNDTTDDDIIVLDDDSTSPGNTNIIKNGTKVFALFDSIKHIWKPAKIESVITPNEKFKVIFDDIKTKKDKKYQIDEFDHEEIIEIEKKKLKAQQNDELDATSIAFTNPSVNYLPIRSRVVSFYNISILDSTRSIHLLKSEYMSSGTIAETPNHKNNERYLLFFDNGSTAYVKKDHIYAIVDSITLPIERLNFDHVYFIRSYFENYPKRSLVCLKPNDILMLYYNNNWFECKTLEVDNCLVKFELNKRMFKNIISRANLKHNDIWFYRGSFRLLPIYDELLKRLTDAKLDDSIKLTQYELYANEKFNKPFGDENFILTNFSSSFLPLFSPNQDSCDQGELVELNLEHIMRTRMIEFIPHKCDCDCVIKWERKLKKNDNQLIAPLYNGWHRFICHKSTDKNASKNKTIVYIAPCGKRLRTIEECDEYLNLTNSLLTTDMFSFDWNVKTNQEFKSYSKYFRICDLSNGKEKLPILCVNNVDNKKPLEFEYTNELVSFDIDLNETSEIVDCCECTDNCNDKTKCFCWQKTQKFARLESNMVKNVGYKGRRLEQRVNTGIFECNSKCKCNHRCTNRLVQYGIKVRLELFKTYNKGWGVRCLDDLPKGTFIAIYSGHIMSEEESNLRAAEFGDEYFAELNYIGRLLKLRNENLAILTPSASETDSDNSNLKRKLSETVDDCNDNNDIIVLSDTESNISNDPPSIIKKEEILNSIFSLKYFEQPKVYIIDAKNCGNISRFLNHSCSPNVFIQNVFIETQDLRYPQTAIFTLNSIKAGSELTWDYNYQVGSIKGRQLYCYCKSAKCRGRLI